MNMRIKNYDKSMKLLSKLCTCLYDDELDPIIIQSMHSAVLDIIDGLYIKYKIKVNGDDK